PVLSSLLLARIPGACRGGRAARGAPAARAAGKGGGWTGAIGRLRERRSSPKAPGATGGVRGCTGATERYGAPCSGRGSGSPLFGQKDIARSAWAVMVSDGFTPRLAETADPSTTWIPGCP